MKCFIHRDVDAVGFCRSCARGLCPDCLEEGPGGMICKGKPRCAEWVATVNANVQSLRAWRSQRTAAFVATTLTPAVTAIALLVAGSWAYARSLSPRAPREWSLAGLGALLLGFVNLAYAARRVRAFRAGAR